MLIRHSVITVAIENTYNLDASPAATDAILVEDPTPPTSEGLRMVERNPIRTSISPLQSIYAGRLASVSFNVELKGSGSAGTPPEIDALLRACGFAVTIVASTLVSYEPVSEGHESCTIYYYIDGTLHILTGCRGTVTFQCEAGNKGMASFTMTGHVNNPTDTAIVTPTYDSTVPAPLINSAFTIGGFSAVINSFNLDMGSIISTVADISAADGYGEVRVTEYKPTGTIDPENTLVGDQDWYGDFIAGTSKALSLGSVGSTAGNKYDIDLPAVVYNDINHSDRDGISTLEIPFGAHDSAGDDFFSIVYT